MSKEPKLNILVTAGPTRVKLDPVREITNISTGRTGYTIARELARKYKVTLLLGKTDLKAQPAKDLKILTFVYFDDLKRLLKEELKHNRYKAVIHTAAVSDYKPEQIYKSKLSSGRKKLNIILKPLPRLVKEIKKIRKSIFLVQFKLESGLSEKELAERAFQSMVKNKADLVVANDLKKITGSRHRALIIDRKKNITKVNDKKSISLVLIEALEDVF